MRFRELLTESDTQQTPTNARIPHIEDLALWYGYDGIIKAVNMFKTITTNPQSVSIKWDGSPAVIFGRNHDGRFIMTDKAGFNATKYDGMATSGRALSSMFLKRGQQPPDNSRQTFAANMEKVFPVFEAAVPRDFRGYMFGDLLFYSTPPVKNGAYTFQPNLVVYEIDVNSDLGERIRYSKAGVVIHNKIDFNGVHSMADVSELGESDLLVMPPVMLQTAPSIDESLLDKIEQNATKYKTEIDRLLDQDVLIANKMKDFNSNLYSYMNYRVSSGKGFANLADGFDEWIMAGRASDAKKQRIIHHIQNKKQGFNVLFTIVSAIMKLKNDVISQLDAQDLSVKSTTAGNAGGEGYVIGTGEAKLVNRSGFSAANMQKNN